MADERLVVLNRSDNLGFGFSLLGEAGLPHIIYEIEENSPAARSGEVTIWFKYTLLVHFAVYLQSPHHNKLRSIQCIDIYFVLVPQNKKSKTFVSIFKHLS